MRGINASHSRIKARTSWLALIHEVLALIRDVLEARPSWINESAARIKTRRRPLASIREGDVSSRKILSSRFRGLSKNRHALAANAARSRPWSMRDVET